MSRILTGDKLVKSVRSRTMIPNDTSVYTDENILEIVNEELDVEVLNKLLNIHEEHLTTFIDIERNDNGVYPIPERAIGNKLRDVQLIIGDRVYETSQISVGAISDYDLDYTTYSQDMDKFYVESNFVKMINPSRNYDKIRMYFYIRPNYITLEKAAVKITEIQTSNVDNTVSFNVTSIPSTFSGSVLDIVSKKSPNKIVTYSKTAVQVDTSSNLIKFTLSDMEDFLSEIEIGDYICQEQESPVPNIPTEMHPVLAQAAAVHLLEALGDTENLANASRRLQKMTQAVQELVDDRVELSQKKIKVRHGTLSQSISSFNGRRRKR